MFINGHTLPGKINIIPVSPPEILYHGTDPESAAIILSEGLKPMARQYVHLALNKDDAEQVGMRKSPHPVILKVYALKAFEAGISFYEGNDRVFLSEPIPARYIEPFTNN
ncbi:MAG: RNA 2'-phosphotransferase [Xenococcaceae cyanobacterium MO_188.B32]|nr:RNA 2'-phosphotransferase [Xenococcaceae cyanobacterium MO_188.B32]